MTALRGTRKKLEKYLLLSMTDVLKLGKKIFTVGVVAITAMWSLGLATVLGPVAAQAAECPALYAGDMVKVTGKPAIYAVNNDLKVLYFPSGDEFKSWQPTYGGYKSITQSCFDSLSVPSTYPGAVNYRSGTYVVKRPSSDQLYVVEPSNTLAKITSAAATALYGAGYKVMTIADTFWPHYVNRGADVTEAKVHPGMLVSNGGKTWYVSTDNKLQEVTAAGMTANGFQTKFVRPVTDAMIAGLTTGDAITAAVAALTDKTQSGGVVVNQVLNGALTVSLAADTPASADVPTSTSVEFLKFRLTASNEADVNVTGLTLSASGLGNAGDIDAVTVYSNGVRYGNSRDVDSNKVAVINFTNPIVVKKGTTETVTVKATVNGTGKYALGLAGASAVMASASVTGSFPVVGNTMAGTNVAVGTLRLENDGSLSSVKLGDKAAVVGKFKVTNTASIEDITLTSIVLKRASSSTASDSAVENLTLTMDGETVATAAAISGRYVTFKFSSPVTILKNQVKRFTVKGDVVDGAGEFLQLYVDSTADVSATGNYYKVSSIIDNQATGAAVNITAGAVAIEKVNAINTTVKKDTTDVEFGTFKFTVNSGKNTELSTLRLTVASTNNPTGSGIENVEVYLKNTNTVYDLASTTGNGVYKNDSMGLVLSSGVTYEFVVRADVKSTAASGSDYTWSIANATTDVVLKETTNDTVVNDITPNSVSLNKVTVQGATVTFSKNALSAAYNAVVGTSDVELFNFNVKAGTASDVKITELKFKDRAGNAEKTVVSEFKLFKGNDLIKTVSANNLSGNEITFSDLNQLIAHDQTVTYKLTTSLVNDTNQNGETLNFGLSGYSVEDTYKGAAVYDAAIDPAVSDGVVLAGAFDSVRTVTVKGYGSLNVAVDNTADATKYDSWQLAGSEKVAVATFKFRADNENVKVTKLNVTTTNNMSNVISRIGLYDGDTEVAYSASGVGATTTVLDNDFVVNGEKAYTLKVSLNKIGQNQPGALNATTTFDISGVEAEGYSSGYTLTYTGACDAGRICYEGVGGVSNTLVSKTMGVVASKATTVALVNSYNGTNLNSKIQTGISANAAIVAVTVGPTNNTNIADGTAVKFSLSNLKLKIEKNADLTYVATVERIGGTALAATGTTYADASIMAFGGLSGADFEITPNTSNPVTAYFLVKVTPTFNTTTSGDHSIKVSLDKLNGTAQLNNANGANFTWKDSATAADKFDLRIPGLNYVDGTTISN